MKICASAACFVIAICVLSLVLLEDGVAQTNAPGEPAQSASEEYVTQPKDTLCKIPVPDHSAMQSPSLNSKGSPHTMIGSLINGFFAAGCRVNYRLTDWILSDKCEIEADQWGESQCPTHER